jgi:hypothetical protein
LGKVVIAVTRSTEMSRVRWGRAVKLSVARESLEGEDVPHAVYARVSDGGTAGVLGIDAAGLVTERRAA